MISLLRGFKLGQKFFISFLLTGMLPLVMSLLAFFLIYVGQTDRIGREIAHDKVRSAAILFDSRWNRMVESLEQLSRDNAVALNAELGLGYAVNTYLQDRLEQLDFVELFVFDKNLKPITTATPAGTEKQAYIPRLYSEVTENIQLPGGRFGFVITRRVLSGSGAFIALLGGIVDAGAICDSISRETGTHVFIVTHEGLFAASNRAAEGFVVPVETFREQSATVRLGGDDFRIDYITVNADPQLYVSLAVAYPLKSINLQRDQGLSLILVSGLVMVFLSALFSFLFSRSIVTPLASLSKVSRNITAGKLGVTVSSSSRDEIGDLAQDFNAMSLMLHEQESAREINIRQLTESEERFHAIFDGVTESLFVLGVRDGMISDLNKRASEMFGYTSDELGTKSIFDLCCSDAPYDRAGMEELIERVKAGETLTVQWRLTAGNGNPFWSEMSLRSAHIAGGKRIIISVRDITRRKIQADIIENSLREKETLLREVHHRVKNNFQIIRSLLELQADAIDDPELRRQLREPRERIHAMALVHERLYQSSNFSSIDMREYVEDLAADLVTGYRTSAGVVGLDLHIDPIQLPLERAVPCGLIINEAVTNALVHAFPDGYADSRIVIEMKQEGDEIHLIISDNGIGFDENDNSRKSLGMTLIQILSEQLQSALSLTTREGTRIEIVFRQEEVRRD